MAYTTGGTDSHCCSVAICQLKKHKALKVRSLAQTYAGMQSVAVAADRSRPMRRCSLLQCL